jgi:two-component system KDP operon response regulator KdpE
VLIAQLRRKLEANPSEPQHLLTEPWVGYRFDPDGGALHDTTDQRTLA